MLALNLTLPQNSRGEKNLHEKDEKIEEDGETFFSPPPSLRIKVGGPRILNGLCRLSNWRWLTSGITLFIHA